MTNSTKQYYNSIIFLNKKLCIKKTQKINYHVVKMKATQLPLLFNNATTGHMLQGKTIEKLFIHNWSYTHNWAYVVLSRVKTIKGLYL